MSRLVPLLLALASCATPRAAASSTSEPTSAPGAVPPPTDEALEKAWDPAPEKPVTAPMRPPEAPRVDRAQGFKQALAAGQAALKAKRLDDARTSAAEAVREAAALDGEARLQAHQLALRVEHAAGDVTGATEAAHTWRRACGPEKAEACRAAALSALVAAAKLKGAEKGLAKAARALQDAEACAAKTDRAARPQPCEAAAVKLARTGKDPWLAQRVLLGQALRETSEAKQAALLEKAEGACAEVGCSGLRRKALSKLIALARAKNDVDGAVRLALRELEVIAAPLPEGERTWVRTAVLEQLCVSYDTAHGAGSCRALEKKTLGRWTFRDFSRESAGTGLSADQVRAVNDHFAPLLQECLGEQAKRMTPPDAARFDVRWVVFNDGRVGEVHLRKDLDESLLAKCLRAQFEGWRYPRYEGEYQNVEHSFTVTAVERRFR